MPKIRGGRWLGVALGLGFLLGKAPWVLGGAPEAQSLEGEVIDAKGAPLSGAVCTLTGPGLPAGGRSVTADEKAKFEFTGLIPGSYELTCAAVGHEAVMEKDLVITEAQPPFIQVALPPEVVVREKVEVTAKAETMSQEAIAPPAIISSQQLRTLPLVEQKFLAALPLVPGVVRTPDGRLSIKGVTENQGLLLVDSAETVDPVTGSFSIQVPIDAVESVEVRKTAYQAQYGRFSGGLTSVETKAPLGRWHWELNDFFPSVRIRSGHIVGIEDDSPRVYLTGPLYKDKLSFVESFNYDVNKQPVRGLAWPHNEIKKQGIDSFTNVYYVVSPQHLLTANLKVFPMREQFANINSLIPQPASSDYGQRGFSVGATDRYMFTSGGVLTTLFQYTDFSSYAHGQGPEDMLVTPNGWDGNFFNAWTRSSTQQEVLQNYQFGRLDWLGQHEIKVGGDFVHRSFAGTSLSHPVRLLRPMARRRSSLIFRGQVNCRRRIRNWPSSRKTTGPSTVRWPWIWVCASRGRPLVSLGPSRRA
jgi:Carboxypeptidase regulatory-like domain/TonB-dependent Receptor Plug Domain